MARHRAYGEYNDGCASAHALDLLGERWTLVIVRELLLGSKRFSDIERDVLGAGPTVLTKRLHELEARGIVVRRPLPAPASGTVYDLTGWGRRIEAVNAALSEWAVGSPTLPWEADMSPDTLVLAMRAHLRPAPSGTPLQRVALVLTDSRREGDTRAQRYLVTVSADHGQVEKTDPPAEVDATITATTRAWKAVVIGGSDPRLVEDLTVDGDAESVNVVVTATSLERPDEWTDRVSEPGARPA